MTLPQRAIMLLVVVALAGCSTPSGAPEPGADQGSGTQLAAAEMEADGDATTRPIHWEDEGIVLAAAPLRCAVGVSHATDEYRTTWDATTGLVNASGNATVKIEFSDVQAQDLNLYVLHDSAVIASSAAFNINGPQEEMVNLDDFQPGDYEILVVGCISVAGTAQITVEGQWAGEAPA